MMNGAHKKIKVCSKLFVIYTDSVEIIMSHKFRCLATSLKVHVLHEILSTAFDFEPRPLSLKRTKQTDVAYYLKRLTLMFLELIEIAQYFYKVCSELQETSSRAGNRFEVYFAFILLFHSVCIQARSSSSLR
jgi:hypothetical protein